MSEILIGRWVPCAERMPTRVHALYFVRDYNGGIDALSYHGEHDPWPGRFTGWLEPFTPADDEAGLQASDLGRVVLYADHCALLALARERIAELEEELAKVEKGTGLDEEILSFGADVADAQRIKLRVAKAIAKRHAELIQTSITPHMDAFESMAETALLAAKVEKGVPDTSCHDDDPKFRAAYAEEEAQPKPAASLADDPAAVEIIANALWDQRHFNEDGFVSLSEAGTDAETWRDHARSLIKAAEQAPSPKAGGQ